MDKEKKKRKDSIRRRQEKSVREIAGKTASRVSRSLIAIFAIFGAYVVSFWSPEFFGVMNRTIDGRSVSEILNDYQMVTGKNFKLPVEKGSWLYITTGIGGVQDCTDVLFPHKHYSIDFRMPFDSEILATAPGLVVKAGYHMTGGYMVTIAHGLMHVGDEAQVLSTKYMHMKEGSLRVQVGQWVEQGTVLGKVGNTGMSTGAHLHLEFNLDGDGSKDAIGPDWLLMEGQYLASFAPGCDNDNVKVPDSDDTGYYWSSSNIRRVHYVANR